MSYELTRPLDYLDSFKNKDIIILLDDKTEITGVLWAFDIHLNLIIDNAKEVSENSRHLGLIFLRGSKIIHISPLNTKIGKFK
jgi:small nuclear ribonucleoprotein